MTLYGTYGQIEEEVDLIVDLCSEFISLTEQEMEMMKLVY